MHFLFRPSVGLVEQLHWLVRESAKVIVSSDRSSLCHGHLVRLQLSEEFYSGTDRYFYKFPGSRVFGTGFLSYFYSGFFLIVGDFSGLDYL